MMDENITQQQPTTQHNAKDLVATDRTIAKFDRERTIEVWKYVGKIILLLFTVLALARVPFVGSYPDALVDYVLGQGKYILYVWTIFVLIGWIFETPFSRIVKSKKFIVFSFISLLSICCIISGVSNMVQYLHNPPSFRELIDEYHDDWIHYLKGWKYDTYFNSACISGGILAELISYAFNFLSYVVLIVVSVVILAIAVFVLFNVNYKTTKIGLKIRSWMIRKLGGTFKFDGYNELKSKKDNQNKFKKLKRADIENVALNNNSIPFNLLPETDVNKHDANFKHAGLLQSKLTTLFRNHNIDCAPTDINVYGAYSEICFEVNKKHAIDEIIKLQPNIAKTIKLDHFNISMRENTINIEIDNLFFSKYSLNTAMNLYDVGKDMTAVFGLDKVNKITYQNFRTNNSALILGKKGSGAATLSVLMALSTCYITHPDELELIVLNPNCEATYASFSNLPHSDHQKYDSVSTCSDKLVELQNIMNGRIELLKANNVQDIDQYNMSLTNTQPKLRHVLVLIGNFDTLVRETFKNNNILVDLLTNGGKTGIYLVLQAYSVNNDIMDSSLYHCISDKYILALESQEESKKIFDNNRGYQLHGNGDCIHFRGKRISNMERIQVCNLNYTELLSDIDVIKTFHETKQEQKDQAIVEKNSQEGATNVPNN